MKRRSDWKGEEHHRTYQREYMRQRRASQTLEQRVARAHDQARINARRGGYAPPDITLLELLLLIRANPCCAICGSTEALRLDHDHVTGKVRGFLCDSHNRGLGYFHDNPQELKQAIDYLEMR
jgi:hypothetical protein